MYCRLLADMLDARHGPKDREPESKKQTEIGLESWLDPAWKHVPVCRIGLRALLRDFRMHTHALRMAEEL